MERTRKMINIKKANVSIPKENYQWIIPDPKIAKDKIARVSLHTKQLDSFDVPNLSKITSDGGFCYV